MSNLLAVISLVVAVVLLIPMFCRRLHVPAIVGFILTGMAIGPLGFHLLDQTVTIDTLGKIGMLYIMFQSGSEIDLEEMKRQKGRTFLFGCASFFIPLLLGWLTGYFLLGQSALTSLLLGSMYGSHTLMSYPIVSRYGLQKNNSVTLVVGGTMLAVTLSLLVLAAVRREVESSGQSLWLSLLLMVIFAFIVLWLMPRFARWFLKRWQDPVADFMLIMSLLVFAAFMADYAGLDGILGAFMAGVALNRLLPNHSPLMNRITFVGNSVFVPMFLLSVGMLIDVRMFFSGWLTLIIAGTMILSKLTGKWLAAALIQICLKLDAMQRQLIFGLTHAASAGTLAVATIGYNLGIFSSEILNAAVLMILVLCTISSFVTEHAAKQISLRDEAQASTDKLIDEWLVVGVGQAKLESLQDLAESAQLPKPEYLISDTWNDLHERLEHLSKSAVVYTRRQPLNTIDRLVVAVPRYAEKESDFITCFGLVRRLSKEIGADVLFYANGNTQPVLRQLCQRPGKKLYASFRELDDWEDVVTIKRDMRDNDMLILVSSRRSTASYNPLFNQIPDMLERFFAPYSHLVLYPFQQTGGVDVDSFLTDLPPASRSWNVVTFFMQRLRRLQHRGNDTQSTSQR